MAAIAAGMNSTQAPFRSFENQIQEFRNIVARQLDSFRAIALRHLRNHADAEDAVQDALLSAPACALKMTVLNLFRSGLAS